MFLAAHPHIYQTATTDKTKNDIQHVQILLV